MSRVQWTLKAFQADRGGIILTPLAVCTSRCLSQYVISLWEVHAELQLAKQGMCTRRSSPRLRQRPRRWPTTPSRCKFWPRRDRDEVSGPPRGGLKTEVHPWYLRSLFNSTSELFVHLSIIWLCLMQFIVFAWEYVLFYVRILTVAGKIYDDGNINTLTVLTSCRDADLEATCDCEGNQHTSSGTKIRRYVIDITLVFS